VKVVKDLTTETQRHRENSTQRRPEEEQRQEKGRLLDNTNRDIRNIESRPGERTFTYQAADEPQSSKRFF
jgi:hypothetical protein